MKKFIFILTVLGLSNCTEEETTPRAYPRVHTDEVTDVDSTRATFHGEITFSNTEIIDHGFCWSESSVPQAYPGKKISLGARKGTGKFTASLNGSLKEEQTYHVRAFAQSADHIVYGEVTKFMSLGSKAPVLFSISPTQGHWGDTISLQGKNFIRTSTPVVKFGDQTSTIITRKDSLLTVVVPDGLLTKNNSISVTVSENPSVLENQFELIGQTVTSISPTHGRAGDVITIIGKNFNLSHTRVFFGDKEALITSINRNQILCSVPSSNDRGTISLEVRAGSEFRINNNFFKETPLITSISPLEATFGDEITIKGEYFSSDVNIVRFGTHQAEITFSSGNEIRVKVPTSLNSKTYNIDVTSGKEEVATFDSFFNLLPPVINSITPGKISPGQTITITGSNFHPLGENLVRIGNQVLWSNTLDPNTIEAAMPYTINSLTPSITVVTAGMPVSASIQSTWATLSATSPDAWWDWHFLHDGILYAGTSDSQVWKFSSSTETWTKLNNFPGGFRTQCFFFTVDDKGYVGAGSGEMGWSNELWEYDFATDNWERKNDIPFNTDIEAGSIAQGFANEDKGYAMFMDKVWQYDPATDTWSQKTSFPGFFWNQPMGFTYDGYRYVFGAAENEIGEGSLYRYDPSGDAWEYVTAPPFQYYGEMFTFVFEDMVYIADQGIIDEQSFYKYDPATKSFEKQLPYAGPPRVGGISFVVNGVGYLMAGGASNGWLTDGWKFKP